MKEWKRILSYWHPANVADVSLSGWLKHDKGYLARTEGSLELYVRGLQFDPCLNVAQAWKKKRVILSPPVKLDVITCSLTENSREKILFIFFYSQEIIQRDTLVNLVKEN